MPNMASVKKQSEKIHELQAKSAGYGGSFAYDRFRWKCHTLPENNIPAFCPHRRPSQKSGTIFRNQFFSNNLCPKNLAKIGNKLSKSILFE